MNKRGWGFPESAPRCCFGNNSLYSESNSLPTLNRTWSGCCHTWNPGLGAGNVENGHLTAVQGRKFTNPFGILLPKMAKGDDRGLSNNVKQCLSRNSFLATALNRVG